MELIKWGEIRSIIFFYSCFSCPYKVQLQQSTLQWLQIHYIQYIWAHQTLRSMMAGSEEGQIRQKEQLTAWSLVVLVIWKEIIQSLLTGVRVLLLLRSSKERWHCFIQKKNTVYLYTLTRSLKCFTKTDESKPILLFQNNLNSKSKIRIINSMYNKVKKK